ncbi:MAG: 3-phosphoglycerate dehydrogenase [Prolixibacteraceae bacterium]|nr:3-phosphoglycerate dehydrogenase [Prolixibacteraceae bacterium]
MTKVLIATDKPFAEKAITLITMKLKQANFQTEFLERYTQKSELLRSAETADAMIIRSDLIDQEVFEVAKNLKIVVRAGAGYDNIDLEAAGKKGVVVMNTPGQNANAVAELAVGLALYGIRNMFSGTSGGELRGRTIGLHGYGYVARNVHRIAHGFGMDTIVFTRFSKAQAVSEGIRLADSLEELYAQSDVVSIHVPARGEHIKSVSYEVLQHLKQQAVIVNTARKEVINEDDLVNFMRFRPDVKYLSDIIPDNHEVFEKTLQGRYYFTPKKMGAQTAEANINAGVAAAEQIVNFILNGDKTFQVNK